MFGKLRLSRRDAVVERQGGGGDDQVVRADRRALRREVGAEARVQPGDLEIEAHNRKTREHRFRAAFGARSGHRVSQPMRSVQQLRNADRRRRHVEDTQLRENRAEVDVATLRGDEHARVD